MVSHATKPSAKHLTAKRRRCALNRAFSDAELRLLIDSVLSSSHIAPAHSRELIDKLAAQSSLYFRAHVKHIQTPPVQGGALLVRARVNENAMFCWAMQYGPHVEVLAPAALRERVAKAAGEMARKYTSEEK